MEKIKKKKRKILTIGAFDLAKGLGMIVIVVGHTVSRYGNLRIIFDIPLHILGIGLMPMFFLISGIGCKKMYFRIQLSKILQGLIVPYLYVVISVILLFPMIHYVAFRWWPGTLSETVRMILAYIIGCPESGKKFFGIQLYECSVVWFFIALFWGTTILNLILEKIKEKYQLFIVILCIVVGFLCIKKDIWYFCIPQGFLVVGYMYFGYKIKKNSWLENRYKKWLLVALGCISAVEIIFGEVNLAYSIFKWGFLDYVGAGLTGLFMIYIMLWFNQFEGKVLEGLCIIGRYTYYAMCIHAVEINCIPWYLLSRKFQYNSYVGFILEFLLRLFILTIGCVIIDKIARYKRKKRIQL